MGADGESRNWTVELKKSALFNDGTVRGDPARDGIDLGALVDADEARATVWTIDGKAAAAGGEWSEALKDTANTKTDITGVPKVGTGTFYPTFTSAAAEAQNKRTARVTAAMNWMRQRFKRRAIIGGKKKGGDRSCRPASLGVEGEGREAHPRPGLRYCFVAPNAPTMRPAVPWPEVPYSV